MRPRPVSTEQDLKDVSAALRQSQKPTYPRSGIPEGSRRLVGFALLAFGFCFLFWLGSLLRFGEQKATLPEARVFVGTTGNLSSGAPEVRRATLVNEPLPVPPEVRRATLLRLPIGYHYKAVLPDGTGVWTTYKGAVDSFSDLPLDPSLGDQWVVRKSGQGWIWMVPPATLAPQYYLGQLQGIPTWVDP